METFIPTKIIREMPKRGMPKGSVRLQYSPTIKRKIIEKLEHHCNFYKKFHKQLYYEHNLDAIGYDTQPKTTNEIFKEIRDKLDVWRNPRNDIQESYILRCNYVTVINCAKKMRSMNYDTKLIDEYIREFYIVYDDVEPQFYTPKPTIDIFEE